jgi:quercetin dioxygenase-like cupin family protein
MKRLISLSAIVVTLSAGIALATPGSGGISRELARDTFNSLTIHSSGDVVIARNTYAPDGFSGWHSHPGKVVIGVKSGQITLKRATDSSCSVKTYQAGDVFVERPHRVYNGINRGATTTVLIATFFNVPVGGEVRIDQPNPGTC